MSRSIVRAAVLNWFKPTHVAGLNSFVEAQPKTVPAQRSAAGIAPGTPYGAYGWVSFGHDEETRQSLGQTGAWVRELFETFVNVLFISTEAQAEAAMPHFDDLVDAFKVRLREDPSLGGQVFSAGVGADLYGNDCTVIGGTPFLDGNTTYVSAAFRLWIACYVQTQPVS